MKITAMFCLAAVVSLSGCAMTPEERDNFRNNFMQGLAAGQRQPVYQQPVYQMPIQRPVTTTCRRFGNSVSCDTW